MISYIPYVRFHTCIYIWVGITNHIVGVWGVWGVWGCGECGGPGIELIYIIYIMNECKYENIIYVRYILLTYTIIHQYPISTPIILLLLGGNKKMTAPNLQGSQEGGCSHGEACEACEAWGTNFGPVGNHTSSMIWAFFLFTNCLEKKTQNQTMLWCVFNDLDCWVTPLVSMCHNQMWINISR